MRAVDRAFGNRIEQTECRRDRSRGQHLDLQVAAGHIPDFFCEVEGELMKDVLFGPRVLPAHGERARGFGDRREAQRRR